MVFVAQRSCKVAGRFVKFLAHDGEDRDLIRVPRVMTMLLGGRCADALEPAGACFNDYMSESEKLNQFSK